MCKYANVHRIYKSNKFALKQTFQFFCDRGSVYLIKLYYFISDQLYGFIDADVTVKAIERKCKFSTLKFVLKSRHKPEDVKFFLERGANVRFYKESESFKLYKVCFWKRTI